MSRRKYRHHSPYGRQRKQFRSRKSSGWGMNLYRNTREGKICLLYTSDAADDTQFV